MSGGHTGAPLQHPVLFTSLARAGTATRPYIIDIRLLSCMNAEVCYVPPAGAATSWGCGCLPLTSAPDASRTRK